MKPKFPPETRKLANSLDRAGKDRVAYLAMRAHRNLHIPGPALGQIAVYRKEGLNRLEQIQTRAAQPYVDSILKVKRLESPKGQLKGNLQDAMDAITKRLTDEDNLFLKGKPRIEFTKARKGVARSVARKIALHYNEIDGSPRGAITPRLNALLPYVSRHLQTETLLAHEHFSDPGRNIPRNSIFDIQDKLEWLQGHESEVVRNNARTILGAALNSGNLDLADKYALGLQEKLDWLKRYPNDAVSDSAQLIINAAIAGRKLGSINGLAKQVNRAMAKLREHPNQEVRDHPKRFLGEVIVSRNFTDEGIEKAIKRHFARIKVAGKSYYGLETVHESILRKVSPELSVAQKPFRKTSIPFGEALKYVKKNGYFGHGPTLEDYVQWLRTEYVPNRKPASG